VSQGAIKSLGVMSRLLDALLDISELESGNITPEKRHIGIQEILDSVLTANRPHADEKGLELKCRSSEHSVYTDPALLERILENFVKNAIRYTESGKVQINCDVQDDQLLITVSDSGVGIPVDQQSEIFEEYYQLGNQARNRNNGLGLGLSIVRQIAKLLDYPLKVSSTVGIGSIFSVEVPLAKRAHINARGKNSKKQPKTEAAALTSTNSLPTNRISQQTVLLIDDDESVAKSTARMLGVFNMDVCIALNGDEALMQINRGLKPDVLVSDFHLPDSDGHVF